MSFERGSHEIKHRIFRSDEHKYCELYEIPGLQGYEMIMAVYDGGGWDGQSYDLMSKDGKLYVNQASHCSCNGLEGSFDPVETCYEAMSKEDWRFIKDYQEEFLRRAYEFEQSVK